MGDCAALLEVERLNCGYGKLEIVHEATFVMGRGEFCCIIGANGCGKTTLLKTLLGLLAPQSGSVSIDGRPTAKMDEKELARYFAYIPQAHRPPFPFTVADVVLMGRTPYINRLAQVSDEDKAVAFESMELLGIEHLAERTYTQLSGGQQQLVLIARALTQEPLFLVMDEPTASLDFGNQQTVLSRMRSLSTRGTSVIMVTHDPDHALFCADRVLMMEEGRITGDDLTAAIITTENLQRIYGEDVVVLDVEAMPGRMERVCIPLLKDR
ncbi:MAG: ABC transporter ATP-binding protein [Coriobacteriales bacterium]|jgi:iron complex transport system ATP-binding protein|nr:ABC transporter ATP-binding protein [Coriobacteriales bacterium]